MRSGGGRRSRDGHGRWWSRRGSPAAGGDGRAGAVSCSYAEGAAASLALVTGHDAPASAGRLARGDTVLIHAATSGVGTMGFKLAYPLGAGTVSAPPAPHRRARTSPA